MILESRPSPIIIQTRRGNTIPCGPPRLPMSAAEVNRSRREFDTFVRPRLQFPEQVRERRGPNHEYNCHGLVFLCRRAWFDTPTEDAPIRRVLDDDGYQGVPADQVAPGDIVVYRDNLGQIEHTGVVVWIEESATLRAPWIVSKWGTHGEFIHRVNNSPYQGTPLFMREASDDHTRSNRRDRGRGRSG
jgi:hypothetical protein